MIARIRKAVEEKDKGFTLVELLVVIAILGILTAIAVPTFLNQRNKAYDAAAKSDVANIGREIATFAIDNSLKGISVTVEKNDTKNGTWTVTATPATVAANLVPSGTVSKGVDAGRVKFPASSATGTDATAFCVALKSESGSFFQYTNTGPADGNCPLAS